MTVIPKGAAMMAVLCDGFHKSAANSVLERYQFLCESDVIQVTSHLFQNGVSPPARWANPRPAPSGAGC